MISSPFPPSDEPRKANDTLGFEDIIDTAVKGFPHSSSQIKKGKGKRSKGEKKKRKENKTSGQQREEQVLSSARVLQLLIDS
jgi:hypothetical protein